MLTPEEQARRVCVQCGTRHEVPVECIALQKGGLAVEWVAPEEYAAIQRGEKPRRKLPKLMDDNRR